MSEYSELVEQFFERYEEPVIEPFILGFSGIDPPLKQRGTGVSHHEHLSGLLGGDETGHYHLTASEYEKLKQLLSEENYPPEIYEGQVINTTANKEITPYEVQGRNVR